MRKCLISKLRTTRKCTNNNLVTNGNFIMTQSKMLGIWLQINNNFKRICGIRTMRITRLLPNVNALKLPDLIPT